MTRSGTHFHFKQFSVRHDCCSMKVGTDAVVLGAWVKLHNTGAILDIGTGSGVIALMLAQRTSSPLARIDAVEIEAADAAQAAENAAHSPWSNKIHVHHTSLQEFYPHVIYDLMVSNPPFFTNSLKPPEERRSQTRHTTTLDHHTLLQHVDRLLSEEGTFNVILPFTEGKLFANLAQQAGFHTTRQYAFRTRHEKPIERWLLEFSRQQKSKEEGEILLYDEGQNWSESYKGLTREFYLEK